MVLSKTTTTGHVDHNQISAKWKGMKTINYIKNNDNQNNPDNSSGKGHVDDFTTYF